MTDMTNKGAAENSAPDAKVLPASQQPAATGTSTNSLPVTPQTADAAHVANANLPRAAVPTTNAVPTAKVENSVKEEQSNLKSIVDKTKDMSEYDKQEAYAKMAEDKLGEDSYRKAARLEREREAALAEGDPTRDPVAKQKAMDMTVVQPGAVADAQKIKQVGKEALADQAKARGTDGDVNPQFVQK